MSKNIPHSNGATLLELVVAVAITGIALMLIFSVYDSITKGFYRQVNKASQVRQMLLVKKRVDGAIADISAVSSQQEKRIDYFRTNSPTVHSLRCDSLSLFKDTSIVTKGISNFKWSLIQATSGSSRAVLTWEAIVGSGWIGGAREVGVY